MVGAMVEEFWSMCGGDKSETGQLKKDEMREFLALLSGRSEITD